MATTVETLQYKGFDIEFWADQDVESPRTFSPFGTIVAHHPRYDLSDRGKGFSLAALKIGGEAMKREFLQSRIQEAYTDEEIDVLEVEHGIDIQMRGHYEYWLARTGESTEIMEDLVWRRFVVLPVYIQEHSAVALSTGDPGCYWDSGQVGYIYISHEEIKDRYSTDRVGKYLSRVKEGLSDAVRRYGRYVNGEGLGYTIRVSEDADPTLHPESEIPDTPGWIETCGGFLDRDWCEESAKKTVDTHLLQVAE